MFIRIRWFKNKPYKFMMATRRRGVKTGNNTPYTVIIKYYGRATRHDVTKYYKGNKFAGDYYLAKAKKGGK